jgi:hypothetical protein
LSGLNPEEMIALMGARENQISGTRNMLTQLMQGVELPSIIEGREAETAYRKAATKELGDKVTINTSQGPLIVSPDKAADYAIKMADLSLEKRKVIMDESMNAVNIKYRNAQTETERQTLKPQLERIKLQNEYITAQTAAQLADTEEYIDVPSPLIGDVDENGMLNTYKVKAKDYMSLQVAQAENYISATQKDAAIKNKNAEDLSKMVDKLRLIETGFMGNDSKGNKNISNPSRVPDSQYFNQYSSTPYMWLWDSDEEEMKKVQLPQLQDGSQITAREVFQSNTKADALQWLIKTFPDFMKQQGVVDASNYRESLQ